MEHLFTTKMRIFGAQLDDAIGAIEARPRRDKTPRLAHGTSLLELRKSQISNSGRVIARNFNAVAGSIDFRSRTFRTYTMRPARGRSTYQRKFAHSGCGSRWSLAGHISYTNDICNVVCMNRNITVQRIASRRAVGEHADGTVVCIRSEKTALHRQYISNILCIRSRRWFASGHWQSSSSLQSADYRRPGSLSTLDVLGENRQ
jgi:hypothetical protein